MAAFPSPFLLLMIFPFSRAGTAQVSEKMTYPSMTVETTYTGRVTEHSREFLGVEYAQQPVGALRWKPPQALLPVKAPHNTHGNHFVKRIDATKFGHICIQEFRFYMADTEPNTDGTFQTESEACLVVNSPIN
jgi:carboxylesterase type B